MSTMNQTQTDETAFGIGAQNSHDADVTASRCGRFGTPLWAPAGGADEIVEDSHQADISAAYDSDRKTPVKDGTGLHL